MPTVGKYCKAYPIKQFEAFAGWPKRDSEEVEEQTDSNRNPTEERTCEPHYFLQESYIVTRGIFLDQEIVFDELTAEWRAYCENVLNFRLPVELSSGKE